MYADIAVVMKANIVLGLSYIKIVGQICDFMRVAAVNIPDRRNVGKLFGRTAMERGEESVQP